MYRNNPDVENFLPMVQWFIDNDLIDKDDIIKTIETLIKNFERRDRIEFMLKLSLFIWWRKNTNETLKEQVNQKMKKIVALYYQPFILGYISIFKTAVWTNLQEMFKHFVDQGKIRGYNQLANISWTNKKPEDLYNELTNTENQIKEKLAEKDKAPILAKQDKGITITKFKNGWKWVYLDKYMDEEEALLMDHCGTGEFGEQGRLLSLRDEKDYPFITASVMPLVNSKEKSLFILGQIKSKKNQNPDIKLFKIYLQALYEDPRIIWVTPTSIEDFNFKEHFPELQLKKPGLFDMNVNPPELLQLLQQSEVEPEYLAYSDILDDISPKIIITTYALEAFYPKTEEELVSMNRKDLKRWIYKIINKNIEENIAASEYTIDEELTLIRDRMDDMNELEVKNLATQLNNLANYSKHTFMQKLQNYLDKQNIKFVLTTERIFAIDTFENFMAIKTKRDESLTRLGVRRRLPTYSYRKMLRTVVDRFKAFDSEKLWEFLVDTNNQYR